MLIYKNLYKPPKIMKYEKDQYPQSTYELDGYISYSWGDNIPKYNEEIDKMKLLYKANYYIHSVCVNCSQNKNGSLLFIHTVGDFINVITDNEENTITFIGKPGSYPVRVEWTNRGEGKEDLIFNYIVNIRSDKDIKDEYLIIDDYIEKIKQHQNILDQFNSSVELWKEQDDEDSDDNNDTDNNIVIIGNNVISYGETVSTTAISGVQIIP